MGKEADNSFDVTMGIFDGTKICDLVGLYIISKTEKILPKLCWDDGLTYQEILRNNKFLQEKSEKTSSVY